MLDRDLSQSLLRLNTEDGFFLRHPPLSILNEHFLAPLHLLGAFVDLGPEWVGLLLLHLILLDIPVNVS